MRKAAPPVYTLQAAVSDYLGWHVLRGSSPVHLKDLSRRLRQFAEHVGDDRPIESVTQDECVAFIAKAQEKTAKANTLKACHRVLDAFFNWLVADERLDASPMQRVPSPKAAQEPIKPLSPDEMTRLLSQPDRKTFTGARDAAFIALLIDTGLRVSEALSVQMKDVDPKDRRISVMGKGQKPRTVYYGEQVARFLHHYLRMRGEALPDERLFINSLGEPLLRHWMWERTARYGKSAGIMGKRVSPHTLRHTFAVSWLLNGGDAISLQRLLGHSSSEMTTRYVNFASGDLATLHQGASPLDRLTERSAEAKSPFRERRQRRR